MKRFSITALLILTLGLPVAVPARADGPNQAGLVVQFGDGSVLSRCVSFGEPSLSGYEVLARAGLTVVAEFSGLGAAVCKVENDGCNYPANTCFCQCEGSPCVYWVYHHLVGGAWQYSGFGASTYQVEHGDVEGWAWGQGDPNGGVQPPVMTFEQICAAPPTATPLPTATPVPTATPTPLPLPTATPEAVVWFRVDRNPIPAGSCTTLRWDTGGVASVTLDGQTVAPVGTREVCPAASQRFELRVVTLGGTEARYPLDLGVTGTPPTGTPSPTPLAGRTVAPGTPVATLARTATSTPDAAGETTQIATASLPSPTTAPPTATAVAPAAPEVVVIAAPTLPPTATQAEVAALPDTQPAEEGAVPAELATETNAIVAPDTGPESVPYLVFGALVAALLGALLVALWRRRAA
jgi:hypothetical protein